jgi:hypothetical protein
VAGTTRTRGPRSLECPHPALSPLLQAAMTAEVEFELAERAWFAFLVRSNSGQLREILGESLAQRNRVFFGISSDDDNPYGPRSVGIAVLTIRTNFVDVLYLIREGEQEDGTYRYTVTLDAATDIIAAYVGTRAALAFRSLGT